MAVVSTSAPARQGTGEVAIGQVTIAAEDPGGFPAPDVARFNALNTPGRRGKVVAIGQTASRVSTKDSSKPSQADSWMFRRYDLRADRQPGSQRPGDSLDIQLPLQARDSDGDLSAGSNGHVSAGRSCRWPSMPARPGRRAKVTGDPYTGQRGADDAGGEMVTHHRHRAPQTAATGNTTIR